MLWNRSKTDIFFLSFPFFAFLCDAARARAGLMFLCYCWSFIVCHLMTNFLPNKCIFIVVSFCLWWIILHFSFTFTARFSFYSILWSLQGSNQKIIFLGQNDFDIQRSYNWIWRNFEISYLIELFRITILQLSWY